VEEVEDFKTRYRQGKVGDVEVKTSLALAINNFLNPIRERRSKYLQNPELVDEILHEGTKKMRVEANETMTQVREAMGMFRVGD
jgi:tryptophanyl-tRNA synthetase